MEKPFDQAVKVNMSVFSGHANICFPKTVQISQPSPASPPPPLLPSSSPLSALKIVVFCHSGEIRTEARHRSAYQSYRCKTSTLTTISRWKSLFWRFDYMVLDPPETKTSSITSQRKGHIAGGLRFISRLSSKARRQGFSPGTPVSSPPSSVNGFSQ